MKHERSIVSLKRIHHRALKDLSEAHREKLSSSTDISEAHREKLSSSKDISEAHRAKLSSSKGVYRKDDCGILRQKDTNNTIRSKQNTYHVGE